MKRTPRKTTSILAAALLISASATAWRLWRGESKPRVPTQRVALVRAVKTDARVRSMVQLEAPDGSWIALWCYLPRLKLRTNYAWQRNRTVSERVDALSRASGHGARQGHENGNEWAAINGGYFDWNAHAQPRRAIIGSVGNGRAWAHGSPPSSGGRRFQRWAWGVSQRGTETRFQSAVMEQRAGRVGFWVAPRVEANPWGLSGLLCLLRNGKAQAWRDERGETHALPVGQWNGRTEFLGGAHRWAATAWSADGRHLVFLIHQAPATIVDVRDCFARYDGSRRYLGAGKVLSALRREFARLPKNQQPCAMSQLPTRIASAFILDSGKCATLKYRRRENGRVQDWGSWQTGAPWQKRAVAVPTTIEVSER